LNDYALNLLPPEGGTIEIIDGIYSVGSREFRSSDFIKFIIIKGSSFAVPPVIEPIVITNLPYFWYNHNNSLTLENLVIHHTWNYSFIGGVNYGGALIYLYEETNVTLENVTFTTLFPLLLSRSVVIYSQNSNNMVIMTKCIFQNIGISQVSLLYDFNNCLFTVGNCTFRNIQSISLLIKNK
jgi:hypothetical protein